MWISRLRVTGGFLDGVDVTFNRGLNVVIGPRGAGKTTLLELVRHALGSVHPDKETERKRDSLVGAVLGQGEIIVDLEDRDQAIQLVVRADGSGRTLSIGERALVLGQSELEIIASNPAGRLQLLDLRAGTPLKKVSRVRAAELTAEMSRIRAEIDDIKQRTSGRAILDADRLALNLQEEAMLSESSAVVTENRNRLQKIEADILVEALFVKEGGDLLKALTKIDGQVASIANEIPQLQNVAEKDPKLSELVVETSKWLVEFTARRSQILATVHAVETLVETSQTAALQLRNEAGPIRVELENSEAGLGSLSTKLSNIEALLRSMDELEVLETNLKTRHDAAQLERDEILNRVEEEEEEIFRVRSRIAEETTSQVGGNVVVTVHHLADADQFRNVLTRRLQGSHTRSSTIDTIATSVMPRMLLELLESGEIGMLAVATGLSSEQASRIAGYLDNEDALTEISSATLFDEVDFLLRDGAVQKSVDVLSTGQKCAVTLPILLSERMRALILDQPEDHLDNAYLVENVVTGMIERTSAEVQTIVATHNANIPVLGSAQQVIVLQSDGVRGSVAVTGGYDEIEVVKSITSIMEGGKEAFERRSDFYLAHRE